MARYFVLYLPDRAWQACLDVMRLLCEPEAQSPAHITVRGPYTAKPNSTSDWRKARDIHVSIVGVGTFFGGGQNTVFLRCESPELQEIWWKRDYKYGTSHITIYDGESREFARRVAEVLGKYSWGFSFVADRLHEYVSTGPQMPLDLRWADYSVVFREVFGAAITREHLRGLSESDRLRHLDRIANLFSVGKLGSFGLAKHRQRLA